MSVAVDTGAVPGFVLELTGAYAKAGAAPGINAWTDWRDLSGGGNDGVLTNQAGTTASGWAGSGTALDPYRDVFDGTNDYVALPHIGAVDTKVFSYEVWFQIASPPGAGVYYSLVSEDSSTAASPLCRLRLNATTGYFFFVIEDGAAVMASGTGSTNLCDGNLHHIVATVDGTNFRVYVDNVLKYGPTSIASVGSMTTGFTTLGATVVYQHTAGEYFLNGSIAAARIYKAALSAAQVTANYNAGPNAKAPTAGAAIELVAALAAVGNAPHGNADAFLTAWNDDSGNGHDGTLHNMAGTTVSGWKGQGSPADPYALVLDGSNDYVDCGSFSEPTSFTVEFWANITSDAAHGGEIGAHGTYDADGWALWYVSANVINLALFRAGAAEEKAVFNTSGVAVPTGMKHFVIVYDGPSKTATGYLNGTPQTPQTYTNTPVFGVSRAFQFGHDSSVVGASVPVIRYYGSALTAAQIAQNYAAGIPTIQVAGSGSGLLNGLGAGTPAVVLQAVNGAGSALLWGTGAGTPIVVLQAVSGAGAGLLEALAAEIVMGHYAVGSSEDIAGFNGKTRVFTTQAPYDSDLTKLSVYLEDTAGSPPSHARAVVFGNGLTPCLAVSAEAQIPTSPGWVDFVFAMPLHLTAGTWYNAGLIFDDNAASVAWHYDYVASGGDSPVTSSSHDIDTIAVGDAW